LPDGGSVEPVGGRRPAAGGRRTIVQSVPGRIARMTVCFATDAGTRDIGT
jgi:hypothetical protein